MNKLHRWVLRALCVGVLCSGSASAQPSDPVAAAMLRKYAGSDDSDAFLREPAVNAELQKLLGAQLRQLRQNLNVAGSVDVVSGMLSLAGNAPHGGTVEEAVVCAAPPGKFVVAAIFSKGMVTVFARDPAYDNLPICIKDWVTQVNSRHADRMKQPRNVRVAVAR